MFQSESTHEVSGSSKTKLSNEKYFSDLEKWLQEAYMWQGVAASFPYFFMCNQYISQLPLNSDNLQNPILNSIPVQAQVAFQHQRNRITVRHGKIGY